jgi:beta-galactosidase
MNSSDRLKLNRRDLLMGSAGLGLALGGADRVSAATAASLPFGRRQTFDLGWRFHRGEGPGFEDPGLDDSGWRSVDLPHDWSIEDVSAPSGSGQTKTVGPFDPKSAGGAATGFSVGGEAWYRKRFYLAGLKAGRVEVLFEGVYMDSEVWLNGHRLGGHSNGYTPFAVDLTPHLSPAGDNVLAVRVRNLGRNSRWYSGAGIYRHVRIDVLPEASRIARWGVGVSTQSLAHAGAQLELTTRLEALSPGLTLLSRVRDPEGRTVWEQTSPALAELRETLTLGAPRLWAPETPNLYTLETELRRGDALLDRSETSFGVRVIAFDATSGMTLNGQPIKLRGGCIHHDNGLLGAAAFDAAEERKISLLRARGYNAVRPSHNLFSPAFLRACDRQGMMVIEETFDVWQRPKLPQDYSNVFDDAWRSDLATIVLSVRNHPSVIMYSVGNEIPERNLPQGVETQWQLVNEIHRLDPTRPVTAAINSFPGEMVRAGDWTARAGQGGALDRASSVFLDLVGYNYKLADYTADHAQFPQRVFFGTESFPADVFSIWDLTNRSPWLIGDFVWTAMDYLGEAGIGGSRQVPQSSNPTVAMFAPSGWPWVSAYCGDIDLIGRQKAPSFARDVVWNISPLEIAVQRPLDPGLTDIPRRWGWKNELQSWTWPGAEGRKLTVRAYTGGDRVEFWLNGARVAARSVRPEDLKHVELEVPYSPGVLEAVAFRGKTEIGRRRLTTAGTPAAVRLAPERPFSGAGRGDVSFIAVEILDAQGHPAPEATREVRLTISGPAELVGFGSASPLAVGSFQAPVASTWNGCALIVLRGTGRSGPVKLSARSEGLKSCVAVLEFR